MGTILTPMPRAAIDISRRIQSMVEIIRSACKVEKVFGAYNRNATHRNQGYRLGIRS
jgi:hypothetical protein